MNSGLAGSRLRKIRVAAIAVAAALTGLALPLAAGSAAAAPVNPGTLIVLPASATAGSAGDLFTAAYLAPAGGAAGTVTITVPAGFSPPQQTRLLGAGYVATISTCAQFRITGIAPAGGGASTVTLAVKCAANRGGALVYADVTAPTTAGAYPFAAAFTPAGSQAPVPFPAQPSVTVKPGPLAKIALSPATATIAPAGTQSYTAQGLDAHGNSLGDVTAATTFTIAPDGSCAGATCTATAAGSHTVTGTDGKVSGTATLTVSAPPQADLAVTETVSSATPDYGATVTFTTTVTNTSATITSAGITVAVAAPADLQSPSVSTATGSYAGGTWTVGSLAPGASATLTITGQTGNVADGTQTVTATVSATTPDPNPSNNTASASEATQPAPVGIFIVGAPTNPPIIDIGAPGPASWTGEEFNTANGNLWPAGSTFVWSCMAASGNPCPQPTSVSDLTAGSPSSPVGSTITYTMQDFSIDTYTLTLTASWTDPNYAMPDGSTSSSYSITFITTDSGGN